MKTQEINTWHVVSNDVGTILGVYGSALLSEAQALAARIEHSTGLPVILHTITGDRPSVYGSISIGKGVL